VLLLKIVLAPVLIGLVSLAGRKWGPGISGWLLGIPVNSGPILLFLALEQGPDFAARASLGTLLGILAWAAFTLAYAWCCLRLRWWWSTLIGWTACCAVGWALAGLSISILWAYVLVCVVLAVTSRLFPRPPAQTAAPVHSRYELWIRMATATAFIVTLTALARALGPRASGLLSAFPAFTTILAVFNQRVHPAAAIKVLQGVSTGLYTAATFFLVVAMALSKLGIASAFVLATVAALLVQSATLALIRKTNDDLAAQDPL
jgi:hypothetical protein